MKYTTVIFDMDGTVLNTIEDITDSVNHIMKQYDMPVYTIDQVKHFVGNGAVRLMEHAIPGAHDNPLFDEVLKAYEEYYLEHCNIKTGPYKNITALLAELKKRGYKLAIVSNKGMDAVKELNQKYYGEYVKVAVGVTDKLQRKPAPDECLEAMKQLGSTKEECIYVGDSEVDHKTALNTGIPCISCLWGFRTKEELLEAGAGNNYFVNDPMEILDILD